VNDLRPVPGDAADPPKGPADAAPGTETRVTTEIACIVLVDDDPFALAFIETILQEAGHDVRAFNNGISALESMRADPPDVLITDWFMPAPDGPALIGMVRDTASLMSTYCVLLTAFDIAGRKLEGLAEGADDYLPKEACGDELLVRVRVGVRVRRLERSAALVTMAATLGHEINNPLTAVLGYLELAKHQQDEGNGEDASRSLEKARVAAERISDVVRRLIHLSDARLKPYQSGSMMVDLAGSGGEPPRPVA
jgi:DNA-binding response OmpR family regulator